MDPCGTPQLMTVLSEKYFSMFTLNILWERQHLNHFVTPLEKPTHVIFLLVSYRL